MSLSDKLLTASAYEYTVTCRVSALLDPGIRHIQSFEAMAMIENERSLVRLKSCDGHFGRLTGMALNSDMKTRQI